MGRPPGQIKVKDCHGIIHQEFCNFVDHRPTYLIPLESILMSSFAVFSLKSPSLLHFEKGHQLNETRLANLKNLYQIQRVPSDTQLRDVLDFVDSEQYRPVFLSLFSYIQRSKVLEKFVFMDIEGSPHYAMAIDGSGFFRSEKIQCSSCLVSEHFDENGKCTIRFGHNMLAASIVMPGLKEVIPLCPEMIVTQDGATKNDSELSAFKRFMKNLRQEHPRLKIVFLLDALYANGPAIKLIEENGHKYIISVKNTKGLLFSAVKAGEENGETQILQKVYHEGTKIIKKRSLKHRYALNLRLHQDSDSPYVNFLDVHETLSWEDQKGKKQEEVQYFSFITNINVHQGNVERLAQGGRTRWKVENETFNTLKNRGYHLEHNYGHGEFNLSHNFILSMFLAFLVDQIQEISCMKFRKILEKFGSKKLLWHTLCGGIDWLEFKCWDEIYDKLLGIKAPENSS